MNHRSSRERMKWAEALVLVHCQLGVGDAAPGALAIELAAFRAAAKFVRSMIAGTQSRCPPHSSELAVAITEAILCHPVCETDKALQCEMMRARFAFECWGPTGSHARRLQELYEAMGKHIAQQRWKVYRDDPSRHRLLLTFQGGFGPTRIVLEVSDLRTIQMLAIIEFSLASLSHDLVRERVSQFHPEIRVEQAEDAPGLGLVLDHDVGEGPLAGGDFIQSVMLLNGAAESLL